MRTSDSEIDQLLQRAEHGDASAVRQLFARHRPQLKRMVSVRMDPRVSARFDPSDVVQDALIEAARRLGDYAEDRSIPFYTWLRKLTWQRLIQLHRHHLGRQKRTVSREQREGLPLPDQSAARLVDRLVTGDTSPSGRLLRREMVDRARKVMQLLPDKYREVLVLRHLEQLSVAETAEVLNVSSGTVKSRHFRAIARLHQQLGLESESGSESNW